VKLVLRGLLVVAAAAVAVQTGAAAPARTRLVTRPASAIFLNARVGLLGVRYCVRGAGHCASGGVERTTDGGRTYSVVLRTRKPITSVERFGPQGATATTLFGAAWRTLDGGRTWRPVSYRPFFWATPRIALRFDAYVKRSGQKLALRVTHDGGRTFRRLVDPCNSAVTYQAYADLATPKLWWILCVGIPAGGTMDKAVFRTRNGGRTWQAAAANLGPPNPRVHGGIGLFGYPNGLVFARNGFGFVTESRGTLFVTRDGGLHFQAQRKVDRPEVDYCAGAAAFSGGVGYALLTAGFQSRLVETHDFGRTWHVVRRWRS
jgi:photosystem II stability/assembly factor-like uncharacterized protein